VAIAFGKVLTAYLAGRGQIGINIAASAVGMAANLSTMVYLTPRLGIAGAAISTSLGYFVLIAIVMFATARELRRNGGVAMAGQAARNPGEGSLLP
jgi:O-antigen/teichoic acid export membrane protein